MSMFARTVFGLLVLGCLGWAVPQSVRADEVPTHAGFNATGPISTGLFSSTAIGGYDVLSYPTSNPIEGSSSHIVHWNGAEWRFATEAEAEAFRAHPTDYAPEFGGHCANAMSMGLLVRSDPEVWRIIDGRLYLFAGEAGRKRWNKAIDEGDIATLIDKAEHNWPKFAKK